MKRTEIADAEPGEILAEAICRDEELESGRVKPLSEYGLTRKKFDRVITRIKAETRSAKAKGELISLSELEAALARTARRRQQN